MRRPPPARLLAALALGGAPSAALHAQTLYEPVPGDARVWIVTHRSGLLSFLGHEHAIVPLEWAASFCLTDPIDAGSTGSLTLRTGSLSIDTEAARRVAGLGEGPSPQDREQIQQDMLTARYLDVQRHPEAALQLRALDGEGDGRVHTRGTLSLRGVSRQVEVPVTVDRSGQGPRLVGSLRIRQRDFGIEPASVGGFVRVADAVDLHFDLPLAATGRPCPVPGMHSLLSFHVGARGP